MTNKLIYFVGNWKMFGSLSSISIINKINHFLISFKKVKRIKIIFCVPNTLIYFFTQKNKSKFISIGAQNCHHNENPGPFTGSINTSMLKNVGAKYVILGHSENRREGENDKVINKKIYSASKKKINVILCIGETLLEKKKKKTFEILKKQISVSLRQKTDFSNIMIAYEPIWSIGTGIIPKTNDLLKIFSFIKNQVKINLKTNKNIPLLYGGSVNPKNVDKFTSIRALDGFLIGGSSQNAKKFIDIIKNYYK